MVSGRSDGTGRESARRCTFAWQDTARVLANLEAEQAGARLVPEARGLCLVAADGRALALVHLPLVLRARAAEADELHRQLGQPLGRELVLLVRAGAAALGLWRDGVLVAHKTFTRYVVRGNGRAQPTHLARKGKSRYGSRLRLQNAQRLMVEVNERIGVWWDQVGGFDAVYLSCPERVWADLRRTDPPPRFVGDLAPIRIPMHVHEPRHEELLRVRLALERGSVAWMET
ncbi:MAG: hypothetical protein R3F56_03880 [Planctomycetota bacterium]